VIEYRRIGHSELTEELRQTLIDVHAEAFGDEMANPFHQKFPWFVDHWSGNPGFACVLGYDGDEPIGFAYGAPAAVGREWWRDHWAPEQEDTSTFSLSELMIRQNWRKTGESARLHDQLLVYRPESFAVLLADTTHPKVLDLYASWQYKQVGVQRPFADAPLYAVMVKNLR